MEINNVRFDEDIRLICVQATSFPHGVQAAHEKLHALLQGSGQRRFYGLSRPEGGGGIVYKAAAEELHEGEAEQLGCESFTVRKGSFSMIAIHDYMKDVESIGRAFNELLKEPALDPQGYCLEWYISDKDVQCMVPLK